MKNWWLAFVVVAGCATEDKPDIDATGTVNTTMTYGGGNCAKSGKEPFQLFLAKNGYGSYDMTTTGAGTHLSGDVICGSVYCKIDFFKDWTDANDNVLTIQGTLTLDGNTNAITGNGTFSSSGTASCQTQLTFAGTLQ